MSLPSSDEPLKETREVADASLASLKGKMVMCGEGPGARTPN